MGWRDLLRLVPPYPPFQINKNGFAIRTHAQTHTLLRSCLFLFSQLLWTCILFSWLLSYMWFHMVDAMNNMYDFLMWEWLCSELWPCQSPTRDFESSWDTVTSCTKFWLGGLWTVIKPQNYKISRVHHDGANRWRHFATERRVVKTATGCCAPPESSSSCT